MTTTGSENSAPSGKDGKAVLALDPAQRGLLARVLADWVLPRAWELGGAFLLMVGLAAVTGIYPRLIKYAFDVLPEGRLDLMYLIAALIVAATCARAVLLYLSTVSSSRIVL
ncbi:MAG: ABC transporter permease, partial [Hyphomicrobiaceae bacterium]